VQALSLAFSVTASSASAHKSAKLAIPGHSTSEFARSEPFSIKDFAQENEVATDGLVAGAHQRKGRAVSFRGSPCAWRCSLHSQMWREECPDCRPKRAGSL
jgi:hypothetical protein